MDWAAWGPTIVSAIIAIFSVGVLWNKVDDAQRRITEHDGKLDKSEEQLKTLSIEVGMLKAWKEGYAAARAVYDRAGKFERAMDAAGGD